MELIVVLGVQRWRLRVHPVPDMEEENIMECIFRLSKVDGSLKSDLLQGGPSALISWVGLSLISAVPPSAWFCLG